MAAAARNTATWINCAPSAFYALIDQAGEGNALSTLRNVFLGGEPIALNRLQGWMAANDCRVVNSYGPTESTVISTFAELRPGTPVTIGRAIPNDRVYVLDERGEPCAIGVPALPAPMSS